MTDKVTQTHSVTQTSILYVVATPIGNLGDMVPRAIEILQTVDIVAAEDTRHSAPLMDHFNITTPLVSYHNYSDERRVEFLLDKLQQGESVALISDAGTPLISDPGYRLVRAVAEAGFQVVPVPGACAAIAALSASGIPSDRFIFEGFLPAKPAGRRKRLEALKDEARTLVFYEAPHRILGLLEDMLTELGGDRELVLARELTKKFETIRLASVADMLAWVQSDANQQRGELVVILRGAEEAKAQTLSPEAIRTMKILLAELSLKQAAALTAKLTGEKKNRLYQWGLEQDD